MSPRFKIGDRIRTTRDINMLAFDEFSGTDDNPDGEYIYVLDEGSEGVIMDADILPEGHPHGTVCYDVDFGGDGWWIVSAHDEDALEIVP